MPCSACQKSLPQPAVPVPVSPPPYTPQPIPPSPLQAGINFTQQIAHWIKQGMPLASPQEHARRQEICKTCQFRTGSSCGLCTCVILLKTKLKTERCAANPPKW